MTKQEFLQEFEKLKKSFPREPQVVIDCENCDYTDQLFHSANCYYAFDGANCEDCLYCYDAFEEKRDVDCTWCAWCEDCYETNDAANCNNCYWCDCITRSYNLWYSHYLNDCHDCFGCTHLTNKSYCIFNIQHTKEEYEKKLPELKKIPQEVIFKKLEGLKKKFPRLHSEYFESENSEYCDYSYFNKDCYWCFDTTNSQDSSYQISSNYCKDCWDGSYVFQSEQSTEIIDGGTCYNCYHVQDSARCYDSYFIHHCLDVSNCFGCAELEHKQYCILNVQYTKKEYEKKVAELKKELEIYFKG